MDGNRGTFLGRGRSGIVLKDEIDGIEIARKIFSGDLATKILHYIVSGAPNPYEWNEHAIQAAHYRRNVLAALSGYWFNNLNVAKSYGYRWNEEFNAYELETEFMEGRHASLHHPFSENLDLEARCLQEIMNKLQEKLEEAGFYGMLWQAGKGNPVAMSNFKLQHDNGMKTWAWIDLESGTPIPAPLNPIDFISFYLPKIIRNRGYFDDVDAEKLKNYVMENKADLEEILEENYLLLERDVEELEFHQALWKRSSRTENGIASSLKKGRITQKEAEWFSEHPLFWYSEEAVQLIGGAADYAFHILPFGILNRIKSIDYKKIATEFLKLTFSNEYRTAKAREYLERRISSWAQRGMLSEEESKYLSNQLKDETTTTYISHLGAHLALSPADRIVKYGILPSLYFTDRIDEATLAAGVVWLGSVTREAYTLLLLGINTAKNFRRNNHQRTDESFLKRISTTKHAMAAAIGWIPFLGIAAYPAEAAYTGSSSARKLSQFMLYDFAAMIGEKIPIWGGKDSGVEHFFNHIPDYFVRDRNGLES